MPDGTLTPDPYASFVVDYTSPIYTYEGGGHVSWAPGTPVGYMAPLVVGRPGTHQHDYVGLQTDTWTQITHTFYATYVPEPSSLAALGLGLVTVAVGLRRRRG